MSAVAPAPDHNVEPGLLGSCICRRDDRAGHANHPQHGWSRHWSFHDRCSSGRHAERRIALHRCWDLVGGFGDSCRCCWWIHCWAAFRKGISIDDRLSRSDRVGSFDPPCCVSAVIGSSGLIGGALSTASSALGGAGKALGGSVQTAVQTAAPSLSNVSDPMAAIESKVRSASGDQDPRKRFVMPRQQLFGGRSREIRLNRPLQRIKLLMR